MTKQLLTIRSLLFYAVILFNLLGWLLPVQARTRLLEIRALSGKATPFETRVFRSDKNIHSLISTVKRWAREKGNGSYLVQHLRFECTGLAYCNS